MPSRMCSAAAPSITAPARVSSCQLPWPGLITNELPPRRAMPAWKEASVRSEGLKNSRPEDLAGQRLRLRLLLQPPRERQQGEHFVAPKSARSIKRFMEFVEAAHQATIAVNAARNRSTCSSSQDIRRQQAQDLRVGAGAGENAAREKLPPAFASPGGPAQTQQKSRALIADTGPTMQHLADIGADAAHALEQLLSLDRCRSPPRSPRKPLDRRRRLCRGYPA